MSTVCINKNTPIYHKLSEVKNTLARNGFPDNIMNIEDVIKNNSSKTDDEIYTIAMKQLELKNVPSNILDVLGYKQGTQSNGIVLTNEQQDVVNNTTSFIKNRLSGVKTDKKFLTISGMAGTGKTTVIPEVVKALKAQGVADPKICISAISNVAKDVLSKKMSAANVKHEAKTIFSLLGGQLNITSEDLFKYGGDSKLQDFDIVFVDEASMINNERLNDIRNTMRPDQAIVFLGDYGQVRPISDGKEQAEKSQVFNPEVSTILNLTERIRQGEGNPILDYADDFYAVSIGKSYTSPQSISDRLHTKITNKGGCIKTDKSTAIEHAKSAFKQAVDTQNPNHIRIVVATNNNRTSLNQHIHSYLFPQSRNDYAIGDFLTFNNKWVTSDMRELQNGETLTIVWKNQYKRTMSIGDSVVLVQDVRLKNTDGSIFHLPILDPSDENKKTYDEALNQLRNKAIELKQSGFKIKAKDAWRRYYSEKGKIADVDLGYAITTHKAQGSTYDLTIVDQQDILYNGRWSDQERAEMLYTGLTRSRNVSIVISDAVENDNINYEELNNKIEQTKRLETSPTIDNGKDRATFGSTIIDTEGSSAMGGTIDSLNKKDNPLTDQEQKSAQKILGTKTPNVMMASEHTDPVFHSKKIIQQVNEELKKPIKDRKFHMLQIMTKHDGLPLREMLELKIPKSVHFSITSLGGSKWEPGVMKADDLLDRIQSFIDEGLLKPGLVTIRIDPIIPGVTIPNNIRHIVERASLMGIRNFKFSVMDSYGYTDGAGYRDRYVIKKMEELGYDWNTYYGRDAKGVINFDAKVEYQSKIYSFMDKLGDEFNIKFNTCGERPSRINIPLKNIRFNMGCLNVSTINAVLGTNDVTNIQSKQRQTCSCYGGKVDALKYDDNCASSCIYCYAKHNSDVQFNYYNEDGTLKNNPFTQTNPQSDKDNNNTLPPSDNPPQQSSYVNHSGGAIGSDSYWGEVGARYGVTSNHYYHGRKTPNGNVEITEEQFEEGKQKVLDANKTLKRQPNPIDLLARNWMQVKNADAVFAIGHLKNGIADGGTGWAVQMAIDNNKPVYIFDQKRNQWFKNINGKWSNSEIPTLTKNFAGIGSRALQPNGKLAIESVYKKTFEEKDASNPNIESLKRKTQDTTVSKYIGSLSENLNFGKKDSHNNAATLDYIRKNYPKVAYNNEIVRFFAQSNEVTIKQLEDYGTDFANHFIALMIDLTNPDVVEFMNQLYPDVFNKTTVKMLKKHVAVDGISIVKKIPSILKIVGFNNLSKVVFEKLNIGVFNLDGDANDEANKIINAIQKNKLESLIYEIANNKLADVLGIVIKTKVFEQENTKPNGGDSQLNVDPDTIENDEFDEIDEDNDEDDEGKDDTEAYDDPSESKNTLIKQDSVNQKFSKNLSKQIKVNFGLMQKKGEFSKYGNPVFYTYMEIAHKLAPVLYNAKNSDDMMVKIQNSSLPFKDQLLDLCNDNNFKQELFSRFCKVKNNLIVSTTKSIEHPEYGFIITTETKQINSDKQTRKDALGSILSSVRLNSLSSKNTQSLFVSQGKKGEDISYSDIVIDLSALSNITALFENFNTPNYSGKNIDQTLLFLRQLGFGNVSRSGLIEYLYSTIQDNNGIESLNEERINNFFEIIGDTINNLNQSTRLFDEYKKGAPKIVNSKLNKNINQLCEIISEIGSKNREFISKSNGKPYCTYSNINYLGKLTQRISSDNAVDSAEFIEKEFADTTFFKPLFDYKLKSWITDLYNSPELRSTFKFNRFVTHNAENYQNTLNYDFLCSALNSFGACYLSEDVKGNLVFTKESLYADYFLPTLSDKSTTGTIRAKKEGFKGILEGLFGTFIQECNRMTEVSNRAKNGKNKYKNYDVSLEADGTVPVLKGGMKFHFLPFFNDYLKEIDNADNNEPIVVLLRDIIRNNKNLMQVVREHEKEIKDVILSEMNKMVADQIQDLKNNGYYDNLAAQSKNTSLTFDEYFKLWFFNQFYANTQMYQLLTGDLAFYKNGSDVVKRTAEFISDGLALDETAVMKDEKGEFVKVKQTKECLVIKDKKQKARFFNFAKKTLEKKKKELIKNAKTHGDVSEKQLRRLTQRFDGYISAFEKYDPTDGQGFTSFKYHYRMLNCLGRSEQMPPTYYKELFPIYNDFAKLYSKPVIDEKEKADLLAKVRKFNKKWRKISTNPEKQFTYTQYIDKDGVKRPIQIKNSEFPLIDLEMMMTSSDDLMARTAAWMHLNDIDAIYFESNVKVGQSAALNISDTTSENIMDKLNGFVTDDNREQVLLQIPIRDVLHQQEVPNHTQNHERSIGVQLQREIFSFVPPTAENKQRKDEFEKIQERRINRSVDALKKKLNLNSTGNAEKDRINFNIGLHNLIEENLKSKNDWDLDNQYRFGIDEKTGDFNIPLNDPISAKKIDEVILSIIEKNTMELPLPGGAAVQVTDGFRHSVFNNEVELNVEKDSTLKVMYKDKDGNITHDSSKAVSIAYYEVEMPFAYKEMMDFYTDENGEINMDKIPDELKRVIAYRIPTEGACSVFPIKVVRYSNNISGGIIKMPLELPAIGGMDYDIDKLYFIVPSIHTEYEKSYDEALKKKIKKVKAIHLVTEENFSTFAEDDKYDCNQLFDIMYDILTSPDFTKSHLTPSNFDDMKYMKYLMNCFKDEVKNKKTKQKTVSLEERIAIYNELSKKELDELKILADSTTEEPICSPKRQLNEHTKNAVAKNVLGVFANSNANSMYLVGESTAVLGQKQSDVSNCKICGKDVSISDMNNQYSYDGLSFVKDNISQGIGASADAVKDPTLDDLNYTQTTINIVEALLKAGLDHEVVTLIIQQPIIKRLQQEMEFEKRKSGSKYYDIDKAVLKIFKAAYGNDFFWDEQHERFFKVSDVYVSKKDLIKYIDVPFIIPSQLKNWNKLSTEHQQKYSQIFNDQMTLLKILQPTIAYKNTAMNQLKLLKYDVRSTIKGKDFFHFANRIHNIDSFFEKPTMNNDIKNYFETKHRIRATKESQEELLYEIYSRINPTIVKFEDTFSVPNVSNADVLGRKYIEQTKNTAANFAEIRMQQHIDLIYKDSNFETRNVMEFDKFYKQFNFLQKRQLFNEYMLYHFLRDINGSNNYTINGEFEGGFVNSSPAMFKYFRETFPKHFNEMRERLLQNPEFKENKFLESLSLTQSTTDENRWFIVLESYGMDNDTIKDIKQGYSDLINSSNQSAKNFGLTLFLYDMFRVGFNNRSDSFNKFLPSYDLKKIGNYVDFLNYMNKMSSMDSLLFYDKEFFKHVAANFGLLQEFAKTTGIVVDDDRVDSDFKEYTSTLEEVIVDDGASEMSDSEIKQKFDIVFKDYPYKDQMSVLEMRKMLEKNDEIC